MVAFLNLLSARRAGFETDSVIRKYATHSRAQDSNLYNLASNRRMLFVDVRIAVHVTVVQIYGPFVCKQTICERCLTILYLHP